jgi:signal transduction histidine kinase
MNSGLDFPANLDKPKSSIRWRLALALVGACVFTLIVVGVVFYFFVGGYVVDRQKTEILDQTVLVAQQLDSLGGVGVETSGTKVLNALLKNELKALPANAGIIVYEGATVAGKAGSIPARLGTVARLKVSAETIGGTAPGVAVVRPVIGATAPRNRVLVAVAPFQLSSSPHGLVVITLAVSDAFAARQGLLRVLFLSGAIAVAVAIVVGLGLGSWLSRPLRRLSLAAHRMAGGVYDRPVIGSYPGEVQELALSLETMRLEVQRSEDSLRGFVASAAHELRTPLTSIQGFSQALLDGTAATQDQQRRSAAAIYRESARLQRLVDALLTLSRYDSGEFHPSLSTTDVGTIVREEADRLVQAGLVEPARIEVVVSGDPHALTDRDMVRQITGNLLRNAVQYGAEDRIEARLAVVGQDLVLDVMNRGPQLAADERARIFERFFRGREARHTEGFGLGLTLVREMCEVLGGRIELVGEGPATVFRVTLPVGPQTGHATGRRPD